MIRLEQNQSTRVVTQRCQMTIQVLVLVVLVPVAMALQTEIHGRQVTGMMAGVCLKTRERRQMKRQQETWAPNTTTILGLEIHGRKRLLGVETLVVKPITLALTANAKLIRVAKTKLAKQDAGLGLKQQLLIIGNVVPISKSRVLPAIAVLNKYL